MAKGRKTGGRTKGTPNMVTALAKQMMAQWLEAHNSTPKGDVTPLIMQDFRELEPRDRVRVSAEFIRIIMPKNLNIDNIGGENTSFEEKLALLAEEDGYDKKDNFSSTAPLL